MLRPDDFVGELGRDELACVLCAVDGAQLALLAAEKLRRTLNAPILLGEAEIYASPSVGVALFPDTADERRIAAAAGEQRLRRGRGPERTIALYEAGQMPMHRCWSRRAGCARRSRKTRSILVFQPQFDLRFGQMMGMEAMLRWRDGSRDLVPMRDAIAAAEAGGLVAKLVSALLNRALRNCSEFRQRAGLDLRIAINLPARTLLEPELPELVERALRTWSLRPGRLMLEIADMSSLQAACTGTGGDRCACMQIGVKLSIDDARAPLSSLFLLATLPFHELKIDLSIAPDWIAQTRSEGVLRSLIELVHGLKLDVIAIAVADEAAAAKLVELGCDFMQADFKGPPVDAEGFVSPFCGLRRLSRKTCPNAARAGRPRAARPQARRRSAIGRHCGSFPLCFL